MVFGRGWFGFGGWGRGNPYSFCRFVPWLPRRCWAYGGGFYGRALAAAYSPGFYAPTPLVPYGIGPCGAAPYYGAPGWWRLS